MDEISDDEIDEILIKYNSLDITKNDTFRNEKPSLTIDTQLLKKTLITDMN